MTDFEAKHEELYLQELESIAEKVGVDEEIKKLILKISLTKDNIIKILKILYKNLSEEKLKNILNTGVEDYGHVTLRGKIFLLFEIDFINFLLNLVEDKNE
jgi:hypothetical protein